MRSRASLSALGVVLGLAVTVSATVALPARAAKAKAAARKPASAAKQAASAPSHPVYLRIVMPPDKTVYVQFQGAAMRMATSVAALKSARPIPAARQEGAAADRVFFQFPETVIPFPARVLPARWKQVKAQFSTSRGPIDPRTDRYMWYGSVSVGPSVTDDQGSEWTYLCRTGAQLVATPEAQGNVVELPDLDSVSLSVTARSDDRLIGFAIGMSSKGGDVGEIIKDGTSAEIATVTVRDDAGSEISSKRGSLQTFGFG